MLQRFRTHLLIGLLAFACAQGWNRWNIAAMQRSPIAAQQVRDGRALMLVDDASYLQAVDRVLGDRPDLAVNDRPDLRAPGYRVWYLLPRSVLEPMPAISALVLLQCVLYALAVMLLWETLVAQGIAEWIRWTIVLLLAVMPTFHGFLFHTITEGVTPSLTLIVLCCALLASPSPRMLWAGVLAWSLLMVTRPALAWAGFALLPMLWQRWRSLPRVALVVLFAFAPTAVWWVGNMVKAGDFVGLHPIYRMDEPGINRPAHGAFWELAKSWGASGEDFHQVMEPAFRAALACDTAPSFIDRFVELAPYGSLSAPEYAYTRNAFARWQRFNCTELAPALRSGVGTIPTSTASEEQVLSTLNDVTKDWRGEHPLHHHVRVPLRVAKGMVAHSNLNLYLFQHELRGRWWMEALRWASALVHAACLLCVVLAALWRTPPPVRWVAIGACAYLFYLAYVQRGVEERYTLPALFMGIACAAFVLQRFMRPNFVPENAQP